MAENGNPPNATLYVRNLNEKIKIPALIEGLKEIFGEFGDVIDVVAKKNLRAKGQAFVVYDSAEEAGEALESLQGFDLFEKPMDIQYAKSRSDATVKKEDGEQAYEVQKTARLQEKERKQAAIAAEAEAKPAKRAAAEHLAERPAKTAKPGVGSAADEYLPPNKTLVLRELPKAWGKDEITTLFANYPGFKEIRVVPGRAGVGFAEFTDESAAVAPKEALHGTEHEGETIRVTYQRA